MGPKISSSAWNPVRFHQSMCDVNAEAVDPALEPEPEDLEELLTHLRVSPVEVRLAPIEKVQIPLRVLAPILDPMPRSPSEYGSPGVRRGFAGVDSSVVAAMLIKAIGRQLVCVHVNHGFMRKGESEYPFDF